MRQSPTVQGRCAFFSYNSVLAEGKGCRSGRIHPRRVQQGALHYGHSGRLRKRWNSVQVVR
eukprot:9175608-Pyramimonas_sp.AAC.1